LKVAYRGKTDIWLDSFDLVPLDDGP